MTAALAEDRLFDCSISRGLLDCLFDCSISRGLLDCLFDCSISSCLLYTSDAADDC